MPELGQTMPSQSMRDIALQSLADLASGRFAERMRLEAAARMLVVIHRTLLLRAAGLLRQPVPHQAQRRAVLEVERIARGWHPAAITAAEFVHDLSPGDVRLLLEFAPIWAATAATL